MTTKRQVARALERSRPEQRLDGREPLGVAPEEIELLLNFRHPDPHTILGIHLCDGGVVVRVLRPDADRVSVIPNGERPRPMAPVGETGLFEAVVEGHREVFAYELEMHFPDGNVFKTRDPYSFLPTLNEAELRGWGEGRESQAYQKLGARVCEISGVSGVAFAVWAPNAAGVSVVGQFNAWDGRTHMMRVLGGSGVWELFIPGFGPGEIYKYEIRSREGPPALKTDPFAHRTEEPPATASIVYRPSYRFEDGAWLEARARQDLLRRPLAIYEVHPGSWRRIPEEGNRPLRYREMAEQLTDYVTDLGFTHVEFLPVMEHPFSGSWGYQVSGYFAPTARYGSPDDFRFMIDYLHRHGVGVILDWVPAHFPKDAFALGRFDGSALYEHLDPRKGQHPEWGTYIFNYGRNEVRSLLLSSAEYWLSECRADGLRLDAVSSMLYLDYARRQGEWVPNIYGGRENLEAISLLKVLNEQAHAYHPGVLMIAEESTAWPAVSRPTYVGGLGFGYKWNMGWMHDTLEYFGKDAIYRRYHHHNLTFGFLYAWSENFILPLSHDEVVYGKRSLLSKMPGDRWQQFANLRSLFGYMWAHPGKKLVFMGGEFGQWNEWNHDQSLDWHLLAGADHRGLQSLICDLNRIYRGEPALWEADTEPAGFQWIDANNADEHVVAFMRIAPASHRRLLCVCNFSPVVRTQYRVGVPKPGWYKEILNTDSSAYGGSNVGNRGGTEAEAVAWHGLPYSVKVMLPPLGVLWFEVPQ